MGWQPWCAECVEDSVERHHITARMFDNMTTEITEEWRRAEVLSEGTALCLPHFRCEAEYQRVKVIR